MHLRYFIVPLLLMLLAACSPSSPSVIDYNELPATGDAINGETLYEEQSCGACHMEDATGAPHLAGLAERAASTVEDQSAREYIFYSIAEPAQYIVEGYGNAMPGFYDNRLSPQEMADLIAYLLEF